jgi:hypothetical protein
MDKGKDGGPNRRDFIKTTAGAAGVLASGTTVAQALDGDECKPAKPDPLESGFASQTPLKANWCNELGAVVHVDLDVDASELKDPAVQERHRIYCYLLMKLIVRFWNGNKNGPFGIYPQRDRLQLAGPKGADDTPRLYRGDMNPNPDRDRQRPHHRLRFQPQRSFQKLGRARRVPAGAPAVQPDRHFRQLEDWAALQRQAACGVSR